jgi:chromosome segregation ATPase
MSRKDTTALEAEMEHLRADLETHLQTLVGLQAEVDDLRHECARLGQIKEETISMHQIAKAELHAAAEALKRELEECTLNLESAQAEVAALLEEKEKMERVYTVELQKQALTYHTEVSGLSVSMTQSMENYERVKADLEKAKVELGDLHNEFTTLEEVHRAEIVRREKAEAEITTLSQAVDKVTRAGETVNAALELAKASLSERTKETENLEQTIKQDHEKYGKVLKENADLINKTEKLDEQLAHATAELETARYQVSELESEHEKVSNDFHSAAHSMEECLKQLTLAEDKIAQLNEELAIKEEEYAELESSFEKIGGECSLVKRDLDDIVEKFRSKEDATHLTEDKVAQLEDDLEDKGLALADLTEQCAALETKLVNTTNELEEAITKLRLVQEENAMHAGKEHKLEERLMTCEQELTELTASAAEYREVYEEVARKFEAVAAQHSEAEREAVRLGTYVADLEARLQKSDGELNALRLQHADLCTQAAHDVQDLQTTNSNLQNVLSEKKEWEQIKFKLEELLEEREAKVASLEASLADSSNEYRGSVQFCLLFY